MERTEHSEKARKWLLLSFLLGLYCSTVGIQLCGCLSEDMNALAEFTFCV